MTMETDANRGIKLIGLLFLLSTILVASHKGEFWPFSIYPMFSQAGNTWNRALLLEADTSITTDIWAERSMSLLGSNRVVPVKDLGVDQIDYSNFMSKTERWTPRRISALKTLFPNDRLQGKDVLATMATGSLIEDDSVSVILTPMFLIRADTIYKNPKIPTDPSE